MTVEATMTIGGKPVTADGWIDVLNPAHIDTVVGQYPRGTAEHANMAVEAASDALPEWRAMPAAERAALLLQAGALLMDQHDDWVHLLTSENGKILQESAIDFQMGGAALLGPGSHPEWMDDRILQDEKRRLIVRRKPVGVSVGIVPWNFPLIVACLKIGPALLGGSTMVIKAPEFGPLATLESLGEVASLLPPGVLNIVSGFGPEVGQALVKHPKVRAISFTGSTETGKMVMADAAGHLARVAVELGGNDAAVLLDDVALTDQAIERLVTGAYMHTGQICVDIKRIYIHESRYQELVDKLSDAVNQIVVGDGTRPEVTMGPINNSRQYEKAKAILAETKQNFDCVELGSYAEGTNVDNGYFMLPYLVLDPPDSSTVVSIEQMSPIIPIQKFSSDDEVIGRVNDSEFGLGSSVWSADLDRAFAVGDRLEAGLTWINSHSIFSLDPDAPVCGVKQSGGTGYQMTAESVDTYTYMHSVTDNHL
jgi:acyl-CoA reductase-like NAD-dependent aldehyde dehydrogenase